MMNTMFETKAFHKSGLDNAEKSLTWQAFYVSDKEELWLGNGIYFWERYGDAVWWPGNYNNPVILSAVLSCESNLFLNLDDERQEKAFLEYMSEVIEQAKASGVSIKSETNDIINGGSCNYYKTKHGTKLIKYSFPKVSGKPQFCATETFIAHNIIMVSFAQNGGYMEVQSEYF